MEPYLSNDKFDPYEPPKNGEELERNIYDDEKMKENPLKKKAHTQNTETEKVKKFVLKQIKKKINSKKREKEMAVKKKKKNSDNEKIFLITQNKKRARTPIKAKHPFIISRQKDIANVQLKRIKKFKNDESYSTEVTELDDFPKKYENSNLLNENNIFDEVERDEKFGKEGLLGHQEIFFNGQNYEEEEPLIIGETLNTFQPSTGAYTILLNEN